MKAIFSEEELTVLNIQQLRDIAKIFKIAIYSKPKEDLVVEILRAQEKNAKLNNR